MATLTIPQNLTTTRERIEFLHRSIDKRREVAAALDVPGASEEARTGAIQARAAADAYETALSILFP